MWINYIGLSYSPFHNYEKKRIKRFNFTHEHLYQTVIPYSVGSQLEKTQYVGLVMRNRKVSYYYIQRLPWIIVVISTYLQDKHRWKLEHVFITDEWYFISLFPGSLDHFLIFFHSLFFMFQNHITLKPLWFFFLLDFFLQYIFCLICWTATYYSVLCYLYSDPHRTPCMFSEIWIRIKIIFFITLESSLHNNHNFVPVLE